MGKRDKKSSKGRLDKYYHLAKDQGYRARSAFKLIQLNKKYEFLEKSRVLIDLCAAPGGWLQVAAKYMPASSLIIGVDLAPIKPIPNVITFQDDITTDICRSHIRQELKTWKADVVLHDGAPNVGKAWAHDAFSQSELVLSSLRLATEFLKKGGIFITKVFRSKDYNKLLWVFQQLFGKVEATKPPSSRNVSAEIFVICRDYYAPKKIDPRFLDPRTVFEDLDVEQAARKSTTTDIFKPEKRKRQREGYEEGNYTLHKKTDVMEFIRTDDPITCLGKYNQLVFESDEAKALLKKELTTEDIKINCDDLKVLGKRDFKLLLKWRLAIRKEHNMEEKKEAVQEIEVEEEPLDEEDKLQMELANLTEEEARKRKREKKKAHERKMKEIRRMQLNMIVPTDIGLEQQGADGESLFNIKKISRDEALQDLQKGDMSAADEIAEELEHGDIEMSEDVKKAVQGRIPEEDDIMSGSDDYDQELEAQLDEEYERYKERRAAKDPKFRVKLARREHDEWHGFDSKKDSDDDSSDDSDASGDEKEATEDEDESDDDDSLPDYQGNSLLNDLGEKAALAQRTSSGLTRAASMFFDQDIFKGVLDEIEDDDEEEEEGQNEEKEEKEEAKQDSEEEKHMSEDEEEEQTSSILSKKRKAEEELDGEDSDSDFEIVPKEEVSPSDDEMWDGKEDENSKAVKKARETGLITPEAMTLARQLANKEKTKADLIDEGFTKEAFRDKEGLPAWFLDDENKHNRPNIPITKEAVQALKQKLKALNERPIKKVLEAKARKKRRTIRRLEKAQKKANEIADNPDMTEKEKLQTINKIIARSTKSKPKKEVQLVVAKGANRGIKGRPKGVKGRYKMVDRRMKKDLRAQKRLEKKKKKGGRRK